MFDATPYTRWNNNHTISQHFNATQAIEPSADPNQSAPVQAFPENVCQSIMEWHNQTGFSLDLISAVALGTMALAAQGCYDVSPARGRQGPVSLYISIIAKSGTGKTPTFEKFLRVFPDYQSRLQIEYDKKFKIYEAELEVWNTQKEALKSLIKKAIKEHEDDSVFKKQLSEHHIKKPNVPSNIQLLISDITPAAFHQCLVSNPLSIGLVSAEAGSIIDGHAFENLPLLNQMWSGEMVQYHRHNRPTVRANTRCSILLGIQQQGAWDFIKKNGVKAYQNGFIPRTNFMIVDDMPNHDFIGAAFSEEHLVKFHAQITQLLEQCFLHYQQQGEVKARECLTFSTEAEKYWLDLEKKTKAACGVDGLFENREEYAAKWPDQVARIAALLHIFDESTGQISLETVKRAEEIGSWLAYEFVEAFSAADPVQENAEQLYTWLEGQHYKLNSTYINLNAILQFGPYVVRKKDARDAALQRLAQENIISIECNGNVGMVRLLRTRSSESHALGLF